MELMKDQKTAVETQGNVLLSAGAGSGKTFVLIEHLIFRIENIISDYNKSNNQESLERFLSLRLRKIALMTFTTKAAGEIKHRLKKRIELKSSTETEWKTVLNVVDHVFVGTIHSFCLKLLNLGVIEGWSKECYLYSENEYDQVIRKTIARWYEKSLLRADIAQLLKRKKDVEKSILSIFNDASLRVLWEQGDTEELSFADFFKSISKLKGWDNLEKLENIEESKWSLFINEFFENIDSIEKINKWAGVRLPTKPKKLEGFDDLHSKIKEIKSFFKSNGEGLQLYYQGEEEAHAWKERLQDVYSYVREHYDNDLGANYADLEYLCYTGLFSNKTTQLVENYFDYFIIDEFQDTSYLQFQIILMAAKNNYQNLFCVGDLKQAIYGFRGGDVEVFKYVNDKMQYSLELEHNFRSHRKVIEFNNSFFEKLLDIDKNLYQKQKVPKDKQLGSITAIKSKINKDLSSAEKNKYEASLIIDWINQNRNKEVAILYRKLAPSHYLIKKLMEEEIGFTAQLKVKLMDDPVIGLFYLFLERLLNKSSLSEMLFERKCLIYQSNLYLNKVDWNRIYVDFTEQKKLVGLWGAWIQTLFKLNLSVSSGEKNLSYLKSLIQVQAGNQESVFQMLKDNLDQQYNIDFQWGENSEKIQIMTVHASKGLEFKHIILAGIHANARMSYQKSQVGKEPNSYLWFEKNKKQSWMTPSYYIENEREKIKQRSESKRLLYVACTRAVEEIIFVDSVEEKSSGENWINFIHQSLTQELETYVDYIEMDESDVNVSIRVQAPLHYLDNLGVVGSDQTKSESLLKIIPELNVTAIASLKICQKKFYFDYVLKMNEGMISSYEKICSIKKLEKVDDDLNVKKVSNKWRGSKIHKELEDWIENQSVRPDFEFMDWLEKHLDLGLNLNGKKVFSEYDLKFSFFGQIVQGRVDLLIKDHQTIKLIDFKTGAFDKIKHQAYLTQLKLYAYAYRQVNVLDHQKINIEILYLDEKKSIELQVDENLLEKDLWESLIKPMDFTQENKSYCENCEYNSFCRL